MKASIQIYLLLLGLFCGSLYGQQSERILSFHSDIVVHENATLTVTETIEVYAEGLHIKRGIFRDFPTKYEDKHGNNISIEFEMLSAQRDGENEAFRVDDVAGGLRIYLGSADVFLQKGTYTYTIEYTTNRTIGFFDDFDELYWNVTGTGWDFWIEKASASIHLPKQFPSDSLGITAYTGSFGSIAQDFSSDIDKEGVVHIQATRELYPYEGLTVAVGWPKGAIREPSAAQKRLGYIKDHPTSIVGLIGLVVLLMYYLGAWIAVGIDPKAGTIVPRYYPPKNYSPAVIRYIQEMGYESKVFAIAIIDMAVKGIITIKKNKKHYTISKTGKSPDLLTKAERKIFNVFLANRSSYEIKQDHYATISMAISSFQSSLKKSYEKRYFEHNRSWFAIGGFISFLVVAVFLISAMGNELEAFGALFAAFFGIGLGVGGWHLAKMSIGIIREEDKIGKKISASILLLMALFGFLLALQLSLTALNLSWIASTFVVLVVLMNVCFYELLKAPTEKGRTLLDEIEGFKMYLEATEKDRYERMADAPEMNAELFEKYLPYAMALGIEKKWAEYFAEKLRQIGEASGRGKPAFYRPLWYTGIDWQPNTFLDFPSSFGSEFASHVKRSSINPDTSSSSGGSSFGGGSFSGGGGFSGGGFGGGGGGGW